MGIKFFCDFCKKELKYPTKYAFIIKYLFEEPREAFFQSCEECHVKFRKVVIELINELKNAEVMI